MIQLERALAAIQDAHEARALLNALLTDREIERVRRRWRAFEVNLRGGTQRAIAKRLRISVTTAGRAAREMKKHGEILRTLAARTTA